MNDNVSDAIKFYGFILPFYEKISGEEFASRIEGFFSLETPRNRHYYNIIKNRLIWVKRYPSGDWAWQKRTN